MIGASRLYLAVFGSVTALIYQPSHPWGASDGPEVGENVDQSNHQTLGGNQYNAECTRLQSYVRTGAMRSRESFPIPFRSILSMV